MSRSCLLSRVLVLATAAATLVLAPTTATGAAPTAPPAAPATCTTTYTAPGLRTIAPRPVPPPPPAPQATFSVGWIDFEVSDPRTVVDVDFGFDATAPQASGLSFPLDAPHSVSGNPRAIAEDASGPLAGSFVIDDEAATPFAAASPPSGRYRPVRPAAGLDGRTAAGRWRLFVTNTSDVTGTWGNATLTLTVDCDRDQDGVADDADNCPDVANPDQSAIDGDALGDACDLDVDGDTLPNTTDGCPAASAATATGCPSVARTARLRPARKGRRLALTVGSDVPACLSSERATLWRATRGRKDVRLLIASTNPRGRYLFTAPRRPGRYYVRVEASYAPGAAECGAARTRPVRVRDRRNDRPPARASLLEALVDTDGDGIDDAIDGCPTVPAGTATGCPDASRTVRLQWQTGRGRLLARVTSGVDACVSRARIRLFRDRPGRSDELVATDDATSRGRGTFRVAGGARYYALVATSYASGVAECGRAVSRTVRVPRG